MGVVLSLALAGCGADEEPEQQPPTGERTTTATSEGTTTATTEGTGTGEDREGGAGDEEPIGSEVRIEGRGGALTPRRVRVPPFIAVRLELRSGDEGRYRVRVAGRTVAVAARGRKRITLDGLTPDRSYVLRGLDGANDVRIVASGESGG